MTKLAAWEASLPEERELTDSSQIQQLQRVADEIVQAGMTWDVLEAVTREPKRWKETLLCAAYLADSASKMAQCPTMHVTMVHALFKETKRITYQDFKGAQIRAGFRAKQGCSAAVDFRKACPSRQ